MPSLTYLDLDRPDAAALIARFATAEDLAAAARFRHESRRRQSLGARALLRAVLDELGCGTCQLLRDPSGAPRLEGAAVPAVSLSHSHGMVACAIAETGRIGVDIERRRPDRPLDAIAAEVFGPQEQQAGSAEFYRIWTQREALAKATGLGFALVVRPQDLTGGVRLDETDWSLGHWILPGEYSLAVALDSAPLPEPRAYGLR